ncbi:uncharacterized protein LOC113553188 isoform X2 [Rhopalosiphum maidis]|uniref:uncharacterized protein LOC113553188 isoform X2 n=1 Tax=Rhopalosiphum maidis TaxID=43146 RepID=UPI000EFE52F3|nr:uncharacterized protein LOC113553188 isoform X2 [Rhopalosiphum maidis]
MDKKKSFKTKRSKVDSTNNTKNDVKKNQVEDKKQGKKSLKEKNNEKVQDKPNECVEYNKKKKTNNIIELNSLCKTIDKDKEIDHGDNVLDSSPSTDKNSHEEQASNQSFCKDQKDSNKHKSKQNKANNRYKIDLNKEIECKSINDDKEGRNNKKKNQVSNKNVSEKPNYSKSDQNQSIFPERENIDLNDIHKTINDDKEGWTDKKKNQSRFSNRQISHVSHKFDKKKAVDRDNIDLNKDTFKSRSYEKGRNSYNTNNQNQRKNEISISENFKQNKAQNRSNSDLHGKSLIYYENCIFEEIDEDLFKLSKDYSLAHCVAEDLRMGAGIAVEFKRIFGGVGKLIDQKLKIGDVGIVERHNQYAFYLVTKKFSNGKPTINTMEKVLRSLVIIMKKLNLTKLGIPKIGCGLDKLDWSDTRSLIIDIFSGSGIDITVCVPSKLIDSKIPQRLNVYIAPCNLWEMMAKTIIVLFIDLEQVCKKNWKDSVVDNVDTKYPFKQNLLKDVKNNKFDPGAITKYTVNNEEIICIFITQNALYSSLEDGFRSIDKALKYYKFLAIQSGPIEPTDNFKHISWIVLIVRSISHSCELWLCGDVSQTNVIYYDQYCKNLNRSSMSYSFQSSSPIQNNNKYISNRHSLNTKETSNQKQIHNSMCEAKVQNITRTFIYIDC